MPVDVTSPEFEFFEVLRLEFWKFEVMCVADAQVSQRPSAAEIVERLQAAVPSLATSSSRSLSSVISGSGASAPAAP